jgi:hypothetical protein
VALRYEYVSKMEAPFGVEATDGVVCTPDFSTNLGTLLGAAMSCKHVRLCEQAAGVLRNQQQTYACSYNTIACRISVTTAAQLTVASPLLCVLQA